MSTGASVALARGVEAVRIPSGEGLALPAGTPVVVTQSLGGAFTVLVPSQAGLFRIDGKDADALGQNAPAGGAESASGSLEERIWAELRNCYDPEIPVNIVDLGLIYELAVTPGDSGASVAVKMTLTAQGCGMGPVLASDAQQRIATLEGVAEATVDIVWDPPWGPERISPEGRKQLGID
jgi:probable FeS assembly SUF system protein SufT